MLRTNLLVLRFNGNCQFPKQTLPGNTDWEENRSRSWELGIFCFYFSTDDYKLGYELVIYMLFCFEFVCNKIASGLFLWSYLRILLEICVTIMAVLVKFYEFGMNWYQ